MIGDPYRADFEQILVMKYPSLFKEVGSDQLTIHSVPQSAIAYLTEKLVAIKANLLDYHPPTISNLIAVYSRLNAQFQKVQHTQLSQA